MPIFLWYWGCNLLSPWVYSTRLLGFWESQPHAGNSSRDQRRGSQCGRGPRCPRWPRGRRGCRKSNCRVPLHGPKRCEKPRENLWIWDVDPEATKIWRFHQENRTWIAWWGLIWWATGAVKIGDMKHENRYDSTIENVVWQNMTNPTGVEHRFGLRLPDVLWKPQRQCRDF